MSWDEAAGVGVLRIGQLLTDVRLRVSGSAGRPPSLPPGPFLTLVSRLPERPVSDVCRRARQILDGFPAYVYPPETVHLTVLNLGGVGSTTARRAVLDWAAERPPLRVRVRGVGYSRGSAYIVLDGGSALVEVRRALARSAGLPRRGLATVRHRVAVANFARFRSALRNDLARPLGRIPVPSIELRLETVELVHTDKLLSDANTRRLAKVSLPAPR